MIIESSSILCAWQFMFASDLLGAEGDDASLFEITDKYSSLAKKQLVCSNYIVLDDSGVIEKEGTYSAPLDPKVIIADGYQLGGKWAAPEGVLLIEDEQYADNASWAPPSEALVVNEYTKGESEGFWCRPDIWLS